ncbi:glucose-6-phosphate isomerase family protein [Egibacter rhizosphaerae]|nr:glucose-6-phosphate isomerase family protein [Egibacter rhizosphaerae]
MRDAVAPFNVLMELDKGVLEPTDHTKRRHLSDMHGMYLEEPDEAAGDALVYTVHEIVVPESPDHIQCSTTILQPGRVGREFFMTKGHFHEVRGRSEVYLGLRGEGRLVMATEGGDHAVEHIVPGSVSYVPGGWAHRSVNIGSELLVFFAAYVGDAGHDYATIEDEGLPVLLTDAPDGPRVERNPRYTQR